jgi:ketosteroid isomerase-like protein
MNTKQLVQLYFQKVHDKSDWTSLIADNIRFVNLSTVTNGRDAYVTAASRFFQMAENVEIKNLVVEGNMACAWVNYFLRLKNGKTYDCLVSELLEVKDDKIISSSLQFDSLSLKAFTSS